MWKDYIEEQTGKGACTNAEEMVETVDREQWDHSEDI